MIAIKLTYAILKEGMEVKMVTKCCNRRKNWSDYLVTHILTYAEAIWTQEIQVFWWCSITSYHCDIIDRQIFPMTSMLLKALKA